MANVLIVDDEQSMREFLQVLVEREGHDVQVAGGVRAGLKICTSGWPDLLFADLKLPDGSGMELLGWTREHDPEIQVIMISAFATAENAIEAMRNGAYDYQLKPFKVGEIRALTQKALEKQMLLRENRALKAQLRDGKGLGRLIGQSAAITDLLALVMKVARTNASVLIEGESGTGKELVARAIHLASPRAAGPFVAVNCGAIPESLIEAELFGHVAGAFTGANKNRAGLFEAAHGGTLLLDEVSELPLPMQVKLLRVLQERAVRRVGDELERPVDVRIVASTNMELSSAVESGAFREDLFYRLNVVRIVVPALRDRKEDVALLARTFIMKHSEAVGARVDDISNQALRALRDSSFPGNVRELENIIERAVALASGSTIELEDLPAEIRGGTEAAPEALFAVGDAGIDMEERLRSIERQMITAAMERAGGVKKRAAELLGLSFRSLRYRMAKLGMERE